MLAKVKICSSKKLRHALECETERFITRLFVSCFVLILAVAITLFGHLATSASIGGGTTTASTTHVDLKDELTSFRFRTQSLAIYL
jgi:hypothetical protein